MRAAFLASLTISDKRCSFPRVVLTATRRRKRASKSRGRTLRRIERLLDDLAARGRGSADCESISAQRHMRRVLGQRRVRCAARGTQASRVD